MRGEAKARSEIVAHAGGAWAGRSSPPLAAWGVAAFLILGPAIGAARRRRLRHRPAKSVALLNVQFLNDHADLEPTTDAERARLASIASLFKAKLEASGRYRIVSIPTDAQQNRRGPRDRVLRQLRIGYGKQLGADTAAWIVVQKVSDLILNINVYLADVAAEKIGICPQRRHSRRHRQIVDPGPNLFTEKLPAGGWNETAEKTRHPGDGRRKPPGD